MSLKCALSGAEPPEHPVISRLSGHVFEKRLIEKHLETNQKCPITNEPMSTADLLDIQVNEIVRPRPTKATSIPSLINLFQNEWDAVMLETFTLKEQLNATRQELAQALYRQDAALRVIARLTKERDEARKQLATAQAYLAAAPQQGAGGRGGERMEDEEEEEGISESIKQKLVSTAKKFTAERKKRTVPEETASEAAIKNMRLVSSHSVHSSSKPGITCLDVHPNQNLVATGGIDKNVVLFDRSSQQIIGTLQGHTKKITDVLFHTTAQQRDEGETGSGEGGNGGTGVVFSTSADKTVKFWSPDNASGRYVASQTLRVHESEVVGATLHATGDYLVTASADSSWAFIDVHAARALTHVRPEELEPIQCVAFHPDGLILGTGTVSAHIRVWDIKSLRNVASFEGHTGAINAISFSENGYYMASAGEDATVKIWDLRKLKVFQSVDLQSSGPASALSFDYSGKYLSVGVGNSIRLFSFPDKNAELTPVGEGLHDHSGIVTDVRFGRHAQYLASTSMDRTLKFYSV